MRRCALVTITAAACDKQPREPEFPPAEIFEKPGELAGSWRGEVGGVSGRLEVQPLGPSRYRGMFEADALVRRYILKIERIYADGPDGAKAPSNLARFDWQDGRGDLGSGWLLLNRDASALTGAFGRGDHVTEGAGTWTFLRDDAEGVPDDADERSRTQAATVPAELARGTDDAAGDENAEPPGT